MAGLISIGDIGQPLELIATKEMPDIQSARALERELKAKRNPRLAIYLLQKAADP